MNNQNALRQVRFEQLKSELQQSWGLRQVKPPDLISTGIPALDQRMGGLPRGAITELQGGASSGRTSLLLCWLAKMTEAEEFCAYIDATDAFDPVSAQHSGVQLRRLLWVRCGGNAEHALKATDLAVQSGGFGVVALDLADLSARVLQQFPLSTWFRYRRALDGSRTMLLVVTSTPQTKSCAAAAVECQRARVHRSGLHANKCLLRRLHIDATPLRPSPLPAVPLTFQFAE